MASIKIKIYSDPGHSWGAVKRQVLFQHGIADKITEYSYQNGGTVYLEEDCDLPKLVTALSAKGIWVEHVQKHTDRRSPVRSYQPYKI